jgi:hypothetical protein
MSHDDGFGPWLPLTRAGVEQASGLPAAVQLATEDRRLVHYPKGKSAMVFYFYAARAAREALLRVFADELETRGSRGEGPLVFRQLVGGNDVLVHLEKLYAEFEERFGAPPILHISAEDDDARG